MKTMMRIRGLIMAVVFSLMVMGQALATTIQDSDFAKGLTKLLSDASTFLLILVPSIGGLVIIYYFIRKAMADANEHQRWDKRISTAVISAILATAATALLKVLSGYFS